MSEVMLKCGCAAHAYRIEKDGTHTPSCIIHDCTEQVEAPNLEGRMARCTYYGKDMKWWKERWKMGCSDCQKTHGAGTENRCQCERPSSVSLAFFRHKPDSQYDEYFCGCAGWD